MPEVAAQLRQAPLADPKHLCLVAANLGAVVMPWMIFHQQSAALDEGLGAADLPPARRDTAFGAVVTQLIMASVLIAVAAAVGQSNPDAPLDDVPEIAHALISFPGDDVGRLVFAAGMAGAALVAAIVVCLTAAWGIGEVAGYKRSLKHRPLEAPWFYGVFSACLVALSVAVEVMNALLLPVVPGFLRFLALRTLPEPFRLRGACKWVVGAVVLVTARFGFYAGSAGTLGG